MAKITKDVIYPEWRDNNRHTRYPFIDNATMTSINGVSIPNTVFVDAKLYPPSRSGAGYISSITRSNEAVSIVYSDEDGERAFGSFSIGAEPADNVIAFLTEDSQPAGVMVVDPDGYNVFAGWGAGTYEFSY